MVHRLDSWVVRARGELGWFASELDRRKERSSLELMDFSRWLDGSDGAGSDMPAGADACHGAKAGVQGQGKVYRTRG